MRQGGALDVRVVLPPEERDALLRAEVRVGLLGRPRQLSPKWFYDGCGSDLFGAITRLPEYYLTRTERAILVRRAPEIAERTGADTLMELGSGTSDKTRVLIDALRPRRFVPFDVSEETLRLSGEALRSAYPHMAVEGVVGDFERHLDALPADGTRLLAFLGSTIGNLPPAARAMFLRDVADVLGPADAFLLGADLVKDPARLRAAYDDAAGVTAAFNRNVLHVLNRELEGDADPRRWEHVARWDPDAEWMEMSLRSTVPQRLRLHAVDLDIAVDAGEEIRTEISAKFRREGLEGELRDAGLRVDRFWTDPAGDFALVLARPAG
jgi:L-histidine Nalpha-methyltransferase